MKYQAITSTRVSTPEQLENGSISRQERNVRDEAAMLGVEIVKGWSRDQSSKAGKNVKRKDLLEMYEFCLANKLVKYLIVDEVDRFMRSISELYYWEVKFKEIGVTVHYASQPALNSNDNIGKMSKLWEVFKAESSNDERAHNTTAGLKASFEKGYYPLHTHQGYVKGSIAAWHQPDPLRAPQLKLAVQRILSRQYTPQEALRLLNASGYLTPASKKLPQGRPLQLDKFKDILCCPYYAGIVEIKKYELRCKGVHERLWSVQDYEALVAIVNATNRPKYERDNDNPDFPLKPILRSSDCEAKAKVTGFWKTNGKGTGWRKAKYRCRGKDEFGQHCRKEYDLDQIHEQWGAILNRVDLTEDAIERIKVPLAKLWQSKQQSTDDVVAGYKLRYEALSIEKNNLVRSVADPANSSIKLDLMEQVEEIKGQITAIQLASNEAEDYEKDFLPFPSSRYATLSSSKNAGGRSTKMR